MRYLTFALGKGRLARQALELFEKIGITCEEMKDKDSRKLIFTNEELKLRFFLAKGPDVPMVQRTSELSEKTRSLKRDVKFMKFWILVMGNVKCVCAVIKMQYRY